MDFHSEFPKTKFEVQDVNSSSSFNQSFDFKDSVGAEMHQEYKETNGTRNGGLNKKNFMKIHGRLFPSRRTSFKEIRFGLSRWMKTMIAIDGRDHASVGESTSPFDDRPINGERSRFDFIARVRRGFV